MGEIGGEMNVMEAELRLGGGGKKKRGRRERGAR